jgi:hypothetical protein
MSSLDAGIPRGGRRLGGFPDRVWLWCNLLSNVLGDCGDRGAAVHAAVLMSRLVLYLELLSLGCPETVITLQ